MIDSPKALKLAKCVISLNSYYPFYWSLVLPSEENAQREHYTKVLRLKKKRHTHFKHSQWQVYLCVDQTLITTKATCRTYWKLFARILSIFSYKSNTEVQCWCSVIRPGLQLWFKVTSIAFSMTEIRVLCQQVKIFDTKLGETFLHGPVI